LAVFCGSSAGYSEEYSRSAAALGRYLALNGIGMVYGGGKIGLMGIIADAVIAHGGEVIGVIPGLLRHEEVAHTNLERMIVTRKMSKRKVKISKLVDGYIALPGGFGTLDEVFEALTLGQLGIESKPVGLLNVRNYFDHSIKQLDHMVQEGFLRKENREMLLVSQSCGELLSMMSDYRAPVVSKILPSKTGS
jgi:uncharacterized protein (TIGR00730 family)